MANRVLAKREAKQTVEMETKDDNIYFNLSFVNNTGGTIPTSFNQSLSSSIVDDVNNYYLSCIRFYLPSASLPIFLFQHLQYYVTISYGGVDHTVEVPYNGYTTISPGFYPSPVYSYQEFLNMVNMAFQTAFELFGTYNAGPPNYTSSLPGVDGPPFLYMNQATGLFSLYAQTGYDSSLSDPITIYMSGALYYFFDNFQRVFRGADLPDKKDYQILINNLGQGKNIETLDVWPGDATFGGNPPNPAAPFAAGANTSYYNMVQEYPAFNRWAGVSSISFKSNTTGVRSEFTSGVNNSINSNSIASAGSGLPTVNQFTDFIAYQAPSDAAGWRGGLLYTPTSQYRLIDLLGRDSNKLDLVVFWRDEANNEYIFYTPPFAQTSIKLAFVKKTLYKNYCEHQKQL